MPTFIGGSVANRTAAGGIGFGANGSILVNFPAANGEYLSDWQQAPHALDFANTWSISIWAKPELDAGGLSKYMLDITSLSALRLAISDGGTPAFFVQLTDNGGTLFKSYVWTGAITGSAWNHWIATWNGTSLVLHYGGSTQAPSSTPVDDAGTMADDDRNMGFGVDILDLINSGGATVDNFWTGNLGHLGIWNTVLSQSEAAEIFAGKHGMDLSVNTGNYTSAASLIHWYRPGFADVGSQDEAGNDHFLDNVIANSNIVEDAPA